MNQTTQHCTKGRDAGGAYGVGSLLSVLRVCFQFLELTGKFSKHTH